MESTHAGPRWAHDLTGFFLFVLGTATLGPLLFGYHLAELNAPLDVLSCASRASEASSGSSFPQCIPMNTTEIGLVSSILTLGGLIGALASGPISSAHGRLYAMRWNTIPLVLGPVAETLAPNVAILAIGRFVSGLGIGAAVVVVPIYISEIAPPAKKGFFGAFTQVMTNMGIFITQLLGLFLSKGQYWRIILAVAGFFGILQLAGLMFSVESPKWAADKGRISQAKDVLQKLRGSKYDISEECSGWHHESSEDREEEQQSLLANQDHPVETHARHDEYETFKNATVGIFQVMAHPTYYRATLTVMGVMVAQQFCGVNSIVMYGVTLLSDLLTASSALLNVFVAVVNLLATLFFAPLTDKLGRRPCLLMSIAGMGTSSLLLGIAIFNHIAPLSVVSVLTFIASFALGLGPVPFILSSELVGPEAVGATQSWALAANWISTFVVSFFFPILNKTLDRGRVYFLFAGLSAFFVLFVAWFVPETMGKRDADEVWGRKRNHEQIDHED